MNGSGYDHLLYLYLVYVTVHMTVEFVVIHRDVQHTHTHRDVIPCEMMN